MNAFIQYQEIHAIRLLHNLELNNMYNIIKYMEFHIQVET